MFSEIKKLLDAGYNQKYTTKDGIDAIFVQPENWLDIATFLKENKDLGFDYLMCISSYDLNNGIYGVAYNLYSNSKKYYLEVRVEVESDVAVPSISSLWRSADWHEREAFDMMGIVFEGHPNLKRILLSDDWEGHPLRKNYKEPDYYHGLPVPKDKSYWE